MVQPEETKKKILIADDDSEARELVNFLLRANYKVLEVKDGRALVKKAEEEKPDLIISDIVMPGLSGWRAIKKIREYLFLKNVPVIFYSSLLKDYELYQTLKPPGPSVFLFKPYHPKKMLDTVQEMLGD